MNLYYASDEDIKKFKTTLIENGTIFETKRINKPEAKFFETVTISNILIKLFLFFSIGLYALVNLAGIILSIVYNTLDIISPIITVVGVFIICFIVFAIFSSINTNKKKQESVIYVKNENFIFNFSDCVAENPTLFYCLPYDSIKKIEFLVYKLSKSQIYGSVTFTFSVLGYDVEHTIRYTNLSIIKQLISNKFPSLLNKLVIDGKSKTYTEPTKSAKKQKYILISLAILLASILLGVLPIVFNYISISLIIASVILFLTAIMVFISCFIYTFHLVSSIIVSGVFIIMGFCVPLIIIESSGISFLTYIILDYQILMVTIFGIIGLCLYMYNIIILINKTIYIIKQKREKF